MDQRLHWVAAHTHDHRAFAVVLVKQELERGGLGGSAGRAGLRVEKYHDESSATSSRPSSVTVSPVWLTAENRGACAR
eukprot:CAMPEP_0182543432 /NCGR_PEP_ID=MMETSP1323-20130603/31651_1 /TAXON_ID=236787 /ORGANISM="Florenciella parvula, Strain RCC1693" /LENGTH=77 /DNA_ID=CAMNT_0024754369 /DNA_START=579 /DNA_END=810 /DNA_ORIENTATION=-